MIDVLDGLLRDLFIAGISQITDDSQVGFQPPDDAWRTHVASLSVGGMPANALNVYLVDVVQNRKLRSTERVRTVTDGWASEQPSPARADCHYLISAWSPATATPATTPAFDEHALLYEALAVLEQSAPLNPSRVYPPGSIPLAAVPALIRDSDLPTQVAEEAFPKLPEFWGTMGANHRWKPAIHAVITLPVQLLASVSGPIVTTRITEYRLAGLPGSAETWIQIGGTLLDTTVAPPAPIPGAWVAIETAGGSAEQTTRTDAAGRYTFGRLRQGSYTLRCRATGFADPAPRVIDVPSPTGEYDMEFV